MGFRGNKELGLKYLKESFSSNTIRSGYAGILLALNHVLLAVPLIKNANEAQIKVKNPK